MVRPCLCGRAYGGQFCPNTRVALPLCLSWWQSAATLLGKLPEPENSAAVLLLVLLLVVVLLLLSQLLLLAVLLLLLPMLLLFASSAGLLRCLRHTLYPADSIPQRAPAGLEHYTAQLSMLQPLLGLLLVTISYMYGIGTAARVVYWARGLYIETASWDAAHI
eukprot:TRINITY_DN3190_c0_g1_i1.p2 TRINITY_DN3190_c0_g1~~TRINITY_DN3190_c0_g1_i1.p2  ORF type:complete len:163 (-),score=38.05 TRINITY_DN3190_c0_g1_i1:127-615(-)